MSDKPAGNIKTALERFQAYCAAKGIPEKSSLAHIHKISQFEEHERKELRAAYEALKAENEAQAKRIAELENPLTHRQISSACLSFRHDFGLLEPEQQAALFSEAKSWEACFQKERDIAASKNGDSK